MSEPEEDETELPEGAVILGMIGVWSEAQERFLLDKMIDGNNEIMLTRKEAETFIEGFNRLQEGLALVLNGDAALF